MCIYYVDFSEGVWQRRAEVELQKLERSSPKHLCLAQQGLPSRFVDLGENRWLGRQTKHRRRSDNRSLLGNDLLGPTIVCRAVRRRPQRRRSIGFAGGSVKVVDPDGPSTAEQLAAYLAS